MGTTSACAENTAAEGTKKRKKRNYLRVRGEYLTDTHVGGETAELPPRARRILFTVHAEIVHAGTTSACAENTQNFTAGEVLNGNYLRVRGEYPK